MLWYPSKKSDTKLVAPLKWPKEFHQPAGKHHLQVQAVGDALDQVPVGSPWYFTGQPHADIPRLVEALTLLAEQIPQATAMKAGTVDVEDGQENIRSGIVELL